MGFFPSGASGEFPILHLSPRTSSEALVRVSFRLIPRIDSQFSHTIHD